MPRKKFRTAADELKVQVVNSIAGLVEAFCQEHLNEEYADLCSRLTQKLARKRPSPLLSGKPASWACGIVRTIGWVNFLDDRRQSPHMKLTAIDKVFGVSESTGQTKSMAIRNLLKIRSMDCEWALRSTILGDPTYWMTMVNGFLIDFRTLEREQQERAFRLGMIPFVPDPPAPAHPPKQDDNENEEFRLIG